MTEATAVEVALLQSNDAQDLMLENWAQRPSFVAAVAERAGSPEDTRPAEWKMLGELVSRSRTPRWRLEFGEEYLGAAETILDTAMHARVAYYEAVAAAQLSAMYGQTLEAEKAAASSPTSSTARAPLAVSTKPASTSPMPRPSRRRQRRSAMPSPSAKTSTGS